MPNKKKTEEEGLGRKKPKQFVAHGRGHTRTTSSTRLNKARIGPLTAPEEEAKFKRSKSSDSLWTKRDRIAPMKSIKSQTRIHHQPHESPQQRKPRAPEAYGFQRYKPADGPILQLDHDEDTEADDSDMSSSAESATAAAKTGTNDTVVDDSVPKDLSLQGPQPGEGASGSKEEAKEDDASTLASEEGVSEPANGHIHQDTREAPSLPPVAPSGHENSIDSYKSQETVKAKLQSDIGGGGGEINSQAAGTSSGDKEPTTPQSQPTAEFANGQTIPRHKELLRLPSFIRNSPIPPPQISNETVVAVSDPYGSPPPREGAHRATPPESELNLKSRFIDPKAPASSSASQESPQKPGLQRTVSYSTTRTQQKLWLQRESVDHQQISPHHLTPEQRREFERIAKEYLSVLKYSSPLAEAIHRTRVDRVQNSNGPIPLAKRGNRHQYSLSSTSGESALSQSLPKRVNSLSATAVNSVFDSMDQSKSEEASTWHKKDAPSLSNSVEAPMNSVTHLMSKLWTEGWQDPDRKQDQPEPQPQPQPRQLHQPQHQTPQKFGGPRPGPNGGIRLG